MIPMKQQRIGLWERRAMRTTASAVPMALVMLWGGKNHQGAIHVFVPDNGPKGVFIAVLGRIADDVHRVVEVGGLGQMAFQGFHGFFAKGGQFQTGGDGHVRGHDPGSAGVGDDGHPVAQGHLAPPFAQGAFVSIGKGGSEIEKLVDGLHADNAALGKNGVIHGFAAGQGTGMGRGGLGAGAGAAGFDGQNRRGPVTAGDFLDGFDKFRSPLKLLDIEHDYFGFRVGVKIAQQVEFVHIGLVADGNEFGESEILVRREIKHRRAQGTALGDKGDVAGLGHPAGKTGVQPHFNPRG